MGICLTAGQFVEPANLVLVRGRSVAIASPKRPDLRYRLPRLGRGVINIYLRHWEAIFKFRSAVLSAFHCLEFGFDSTVHFKGISGVR